MITIYVKQSADAAPYDIIDWLESNISPAGNRYYYDSDILRETGLYRVELFFSISFEYEDDVTMFKLR